MLDRISISEHMDWTDRRSCGRMDDFYLGHRDRKKSDNNKKLGSSGERESTHSGRSL